MRLDFSEICSRGGRPSNQDSACGRSDGGKACFVVCDGLGAYSGSGIASEICAREMCAGFMERGSATAESVAAITEDTHRRIIEEKYNSDGMDNACTTFAGVFTDGIRTVVAHIGDSRVYLIRGGAIRFCTADHSVAQLDVTGGRISRRDLRFHRDQNKLTRVLGGKRYLPPDVRVFEEAPRAGDAFLLCTDGFWEYVEESEMEEALALEGADGGDMLRFMENRLISRAPADNDNYTALLVRALTEEE